MKLKMYCVYDSTAKAFMNPWYAPNTPSAIRAFADAIEKDPMIAKHPIDFSLHEIGTFDTNNASIETLIAPVSLGLASEFIRQPAQLTAL